MRQRHRGGIPGPPEQHDEAVSGLAENSVEAVDAALTAGADGVEVDVRLSSDGVPVCVHEGDLMRVAGVPAQVGGLTYDQLRRVPLAGGQRIASWGEVAGLVSGRGTLLRVLWDHGVVERADHEGLTVRCWTVNRGLDARLLQIAGVAGVITDDPAALRADISAPTEARVVQAST
jgi:glycerophosphoryl diester phosphodiesterase